MNLSEREVRDLSRALSTRRSPWVVWVVLWLTGAVLLGVVFAAAWVLVPYAVTQGGVGLLLILAALLAIVWGAR